MSLPFLVPGNFPPTIGAIVYDSRLIAALAEIGVEAALHPLGGQHPEADEAAVAAVATFAADAVRSLLVIDGFCLYAFRQETALLERAVGIVHHPMSGEPQLPDSTRARYLGLERKLLPHLKQVVVPSSVVATDLVERVGILPARVTVITPGIPEAGRSAGSGGSTCQLLAVASLIPRKGHDTVLKALQTLADLDWRLTICGDATMDASCAAELAALAEEPGLRNRVTFAGTHGAEAMEALWQTADIFVSGSHFEGYGMAVAEAVRHGLPLAVTTKAAAPEVIPKDGSAMVEPGDTVQMAKALRRMIFDHTLRAKLSDAAWSFGRSFPTWPDQARRFASLLAG